MKICITAIAAKCGGECATRFLPKHLWGCILTRGQRNSSTQKLVPMMGTEKSEGDGSDNDGIDDISRCFTDSWLRTSRAVTHRGLATHGLFQERYKRLEKYANLLLSMTQDGDSGVECYNESTREWMLRDKSASARFREWSRRLFPPDTGGSGVALPLIAQNRVQPTEQNEKAYEVLRRAMARDFCKRSDALCKQIEESYSDQWTESRDGTTDQESR